MSRGIARTARRPPLPAALASAAAGAAALLAVAAWPRAMAGWLAAYVFWSSVPIGALCLLMMMRIIPGGWREELEGPAEAALRSLPLAALAALPILAAPGAIYPWTEGAGEGAFRAAYMTPGLFALRTVLFFVILGGAALMLRRSRSTAIAVAGLILLVLLDTLMAVDWLMSLDAGFHSSGFGLYVLSIQATIALGLLILWHLRSGEAHRPGLLGALLLCALLLWAYFAFMQYFIIWSGDPPQGAAWFRRHATGAWPWAEHAVGALGLVPLLLLLAPSVRRSRRGMLAIASAVLAGKALEVAWLVLPFHPGGPPILAAILGLAGLGGGVVLMMVRA
jgi:hypothetical protein